MRTSCAWATTSLRGRKTSWPTNVRIDYRVSGIGSASCGPDLAPKYRLYLASNGTARVQESRLKSAGIGPYFQQVFISQKLGANKPSPAFFHRCFAQIPDFDPQKALMIGDSLTSDIRGAKGAGIAACWFNPRQEAPVPGISMDYEIHSLPQLREFL